MKLLKQKWNPVNTQNETVKILKEQIIKSEALLTDNVTAEQLEQQINSIKKSINGLTEKKADLETSDRPNQNITHSEKVQQ